MDKWNNLYSRIRKNKIHVIEIEEDYYMIFNNKIYRCSNNVYDRYIYYFEKDNLTVTKEQMNKLEIIVKNEYENGELRIWEDLKKFIGRLDERDIDIANKSCDKYINGLIEADIFLERSHTGFLDGNEIWVDWIKKVETDRQYEIRIQTSSNILSKISNIPLNMAVDFKIEDKINWKINIIKRRGGGIDNITQNKDEWKYTADILIKVIE
ncbi:hypothetical protein [Brassicibacter mesophilus]|uniref:hypothetical protein n=1 Tax=Brassicibacter mesophilus TaxID=745119 RepID=UPI003D1CDECA